MGDWIKKNKFEAGLLFVVVLIAIGAYVAGNGQGKKYTVHKDNFDAAASQKKSLEAKKPYPSRENQEVFTGRVAEYRRVIEGLQAALLKFRPKEFESIAPAEFTDKLNAAIASATKTYTDAGIEFPTDKWRLGFERYTESSAREDATAYLSYQLDALSWLFGALAESRPSALLNVHRPELPVEKGEPMDGGESSSTSRGRSSRRSSGDSSEKPFHVLPLELTFKASEPAVRSFLAKVASTPDHFFVIRTLRIQNEKRDKGPQRDDVEFKDTGPAGDAFQPTFEVIPDDGAPGPEGDLPPVPEGDPLFPEDDPAPVPEAAGGDRILGQVLGAEELYVYLELELIFFQAPDEDDPKKS